MICFEILVSPWRINKVYMPAASLVKLNCCRLPVILHVLTFIPEAVNMVTVLPIMPGVAVIVILPLPGLGDTFTLSVFSIMVNWSTALLVHPLASVKV